MKMGHFEMVTMLLAATVLMDIFQVKAEVLDMAENAFDDEYLKCYNRMEVKYIPQMHREEWANDALLRTVWDSAGLQWEARKAKIFLPENFKDAYGIALMAYVTEAQEHTPFYHTFNSAVKMAGLSRRRYIYNFPFKAFHFYLVRALQLLRRPCEESYKNVVYSTIPDVSFTFGEQNQARLGNFTLAYSAKPETAERVLTIQTCFGVAVGKFLNKENKEVVLIPLSEVFQVSRKGTGDDLILQSINSTCSYYECAFLGGLKTENCIANPEYIDPRYLYNPDLDSQKLEDSVPGHKPWAPCKLGRINLDSAKMPEIKELQTEENPLLPDEKPALGPVPVPGPKFHPSASSGNTLLPSVTASTILLVASAVNFIEL
ncbi:ecto-ADP-ribosyltransferase 3 isoform X1 [Grammomys surdaster]|uniref:ecto-ADP-ribosyltransferase 3 isoform X1 n=1 Tax=Grammomys surdaster TaxID=491861 RepID=UPI0010A06ECB|nr:ecto-ADP-ribosyltransferase 3 isoform X1 [Grammomys surdaster]XP_028644986.1 ecto-ADP-ribosyltransferase 3 isoform X1 [Grammomys surdaster]XP_028644987.1 ecto-ADP-ribosyltransferase 3 isoform X1 [Grammomys surdaster]